LSAKSVTSSRFYRFDTRRAQRILFLSFRLPEKKRKCATDWFRKSFF
jgi:hypothetical protein